LENEAEAQAVISVLTTHHTYFFREFAHFEFLLEKVLPSLVSVMEQNGEDTLRIWSAACSKGQEAYSLAMFLSIHWSTIAPGMRFEIFGTDVDSGSIELAENGVYRWSELKEVPAQYLGRHWARGQDDLADWARANESIAGHCSFSQENLLEIGKAENRDRLHGKFHVIFCRNVFIYFTPEQIRSVSAELLECLHPSGFLFVGRSETLNNLGLKMRYLGPSIYQRLEAKHLSSQANVVAKTPIRVLCVDDSPVVLRLLKAVLAGDADFQVVATASNGLEATLVLRQQEVDLITLDIHMPEQDGVEFLKQSAGKRLPPVVIVSSVAREEMALAQECLKLGAVDYVEKPSLGDLKERSEEIQNKLKSATRHRAIGQSGSGQTELDRVFQTKSTTAPHPSALRLIHVRPPKVRTENSDEKNWSDDLARFMTVISRESAQVATLVLLDGDAAELRSLIGRWRRLPGVSFHEVPLGQPLPEQHWSAGMIVGHIQDFKPMQRSILERSTSVSIVMIGELSAEAFSTLRASNRQKWIIEERAMTSRFTNAIRELRAQIVPLASIAYHSILDPETGGKK
jgi:chemotaxis protein methyltransferase CheR